MDGDGNGGGIVPYRYRKTDFFNAVQWAAGLELFLLINDPWRLFFTTDHPNGAPFTAYPDLLALLMDRSLRARHIESLPKDAMEVTTLASIAREYTLTEIAIMTRAAPARLLGLADRGHLGPNARADIAVYRPQPDVAAMFRDAALVLKDGVPVIRDGVPVAHPFGRAVAVRPGFDATTDRGLAAFYASTYGVPHTAFDVPRRRQARPHPTVRGGAMSDVATARATPLVRNGVSIDATYAEAFDMRATALVITAPTLRWARIAATSLTGFATSVIACGVEAGIDAEMAPEATPDGRPGVRVLLFAGSTGRTAEATDQPRRPVRPDQPRIGLLFRPGRDANR